jgi:hypothetical protein
MGRKEKNVGFAYVGRSSLCHQADGALLLLLKPFPEVEVWLSDPKNARGRKRIN